MFFQPSRLTALVPLALACMLVTVACSSEAGTPARAALPVILLTGFEPFGEGRPPNSSWEGIQALDGQTWRGHKLICRRLPVVWGQPRVLLDQWIGELKPVAVFSFGQGLPGHFAIETVARNQRAQIADNAGQLPVAEKIAPGGPAEHRSSAPAEQLASLIGKREPPVQLSTSAGSYLCEEALYTLEDLKAAGRAPAHVLFCHVPPLGGNVSASKIQSFVLELLAAWHTLYQAAQPEAAKQPAAEPAGAAQAADPRTASVRQFIERYFRTWSNQEMDAYADGFAPEAVIQFLDGRGNVQTQTAKVFLSEQRRYQAQRPAKEYPLSIDIRFEERLARAVVYWKLEDGSGRSKTGFDHFTLVEQSGKWRILNLVFYEATRMGDAGKP